MTLTRTPCELDKMSLFQDLKLKRRKVDSRCSSDGESVADTSTSSPDLVSPASPKMSENVPSPDSTPRAESLGGAGEATLVAEEPAVFDGGGGGGGLGGGGGGGGLGVGVGVGVGVSIVGSGVQSVIRAVPRALSPPAPRPALAATPPQPPRPHSSPVRHSPEAAKLSPLVTAARSSPAPPPRHSPSVITSQQQAVTQLWAQSSRINGVKPELIGGSFSPVSLLSAAATMKPPLLGRAPSGPVAPPLRQTPTVIMGEAGGVRTMIWSAPAAPAAATVAVATQDTHPSTSACWPATAPNPEESAAHMLLNLGGTHEPARVRPRPPTRPPPPFGAAPLNMERLWAGDPAQPGLQALNLTAAQQYAPRPPLAAPTAATAADVKLTVLGEQAAPAGGPSADSEPADDDDQPMICMICEDKATGLHYGIITCEGCKGFFKRTVQNRRVYTCVADGNCEITKAQRNRCQYCRFKKCIEQGMVLQAVREDRMPGGRNSGAVYNLYKVKYKKHKKTGKQAQQAAQQQQQQAAQAAAAKQVAADKALVSVQVKSEPQSSIPAHLVNGTILKTALTNPSEVVHLRQRLDNAVSSSRDRSYPIENTLSMIQTLIDCDEFQDIATLQNLDELLDHKSDLNEKLCQIGDSIVYKLVQWTKRLPFYLELPVEVHTRLLTHKWHELLVLTTSAYQAIHGQAAKSSHSHPHQQPQPPSSPADANVDPDFTQEKIDEVDFNQQVSTNLCTLQSCLTSMMGRPITIDQLRQDVGLMVEKITQVTLMFRRIRLTMEEYVCLKVITMLHQARPGGMSGSSGGASSGGGSAPGGSELEAIQERYMTCLRAYTHHACPQQPGRYHELLVRLPEVQSAAALLLESKMFYVPFLLNSAIQR